MLARYCAFAMRYEVRMFTSLMLLFGGLASYFTDYVWLTVWSIMLFPVMLIGTANLIVKWLLGESGWFFDDLPERLMYLAGWLLLFGVWLY